MEASSNFDNFSGSTRSSWPLFKDKRIGKIMLQTGTLSVGDVANRLDKSDKKSLEKKLSSCKKARKSESKSCKKEGSRCDKAVTKREKACSL